MASGVTFEEIECKTIINSTNTPGLGFRWSAEGIGRHTRGLSLL